MSTKIFVVVLVALVIAASAGLLYISSAGLATFWHDLAFEGASILISGVVIAALFEWITSSQQARAAEQRWKPVADPTIRSIEKRLRLTALMYGSDVATKETWTFEEVAEAFRARFDGMTSRHISEWDVAAKRLDFAKDLTDHATQAVSGILDRALPRLLETGGNQKIAERLLEFEELWLDVLSSIRGAELVKERPIPFVTELSFQEMTGDVASAIQLFLGGCSKVQKVLPRESAKTE